MPSTVGSRDFSSDQDIHIWSGSLKCATAYLTRLAPLLSLDEHRRAQQFRYEGDRRRFIFRRAVLRMVIASYIDTVPKELTFVADWNGKPQCAEALSHRQLHFNATSSHAAMIIAVALRERIGVDLEYIRPLPDLERLAQACLS